MGVLNPPQVGRYTLDLSTAHDREQVSVNARSVYLVDLTDGQELELALAPEGPYFPIRRPGKVVSCDVLIPAIYLRNAVGSGSAVFAFSPGEIAFDFPGSTAAPAAPVVLAEFAPRQEGGVSAPVLIHGNGAITAPQSWQNLEVGSPTYGVFSSGESGNGNGGGPPVRAILSGALQGYEYALEDIVRVPRVAGDRTLMNAWFGAWNDQVGSARAHGIGLMVTGGDGGHNDGRWHLIASPAQGVGDGVPANWLTLVSLDVDTGIEVPGVEWQRLRLAIGCARGGVPYVRVFVDGVLAFEHSAVIEVTCAFSLPWSIGAASTGGTAGSHVMHGLVSHKWLRRVL